MNNALVMISIASAVTIGAMGPGPSFVMVARTAVASSRSDGIYAALGMGLGGMLFAVAALFGLHALLAAVPWLYMSMKIFGGLYLMYLGCKIIRGATELLIVSDNGSAVQPAKATRSFLLGLGTQISNPKTAIFYASIFAALLPHDVPLSLMLSLPFIVLLIESVWYAVVALVLSSASPRAAYLRYKAWIDRMAGGVMILLGVRLAGSARAF
jgi:threonine/homoserine/homoserine lactone efflux protein